MQKEETFVSKWYALIDASKRWRKEKYEDQWNKMLDYYKGKFFLSDDPNNTAINFIYSTIRIILPSIYSVNPYIYIVPRKETELENADKMEPLVNYGFDVINLRHISHLVTLDALIFGYGWLKINFDPKIQSDIPIVERISPKNIFIPKNTRGAELPKWIAMRAWLTEEEIKVFKNYDYKPEFFVAENTVESIATVRLTDKESEVQEGFEVFEIWDTIRKTVTTILPEKNLILEETKPYPFEVEHSPFVQLRFNETPDDPYPIPECQSWVQQQLAVNTFMTNLVNYVDKMRPIIIYEDGALTPTQIEKLNSAEAGAKVAVNNIEKIKIFSPPALPFDNDKLMNYSKEGIIYTSRVNEYMRGVPGSVRTATEADIIESHSRLSSGDKIVVIEEFIKTVARKWMSIAKSTLTEDKIIAIIGKEGGTQKFLTVTPEDIQKEYDIRVEVGSSTPYNEIVVRRQIMDLAALINSNPLLQQLVDLRKMLEIIIKSFPIKGLRGILKSIPEAEPQLPQAPLPPLPMMPEAGLSPSALPSMPMGQLPIFPPTSGVGDKMGEIIAAAAGSQQMRSNLSGV